MPFKFELIVARSALTLFDYCHSHRTQPRWRDDPLLSIEAALMEEVVGVGCIIIGRNFDTQF